MASLKRDLLKKGGKQGQACTYGGRRSSYVGSLWLNNRNYSERVPHFCRLTAVSHEDGKRKLQRGLKCYAKREVNSLAF